MMLSIKKAPWQVVVTFVCAWLIIGDSDVLAQFTFSPAQGVWDVSGDYPNDEFDSTNQITLSQDDKGKITGFGTGFASDSGIDVNLIFNFSGSIKTISEAVRASLTMKITGTATDGIVTLPVKGNIKLALDLDKANNLLVGSGAGSICVQGRCEKVGGPVQFDIPQPMDGSWTLGLDTQPAGSGNRFVGTAAATLSNGRVLPFSLNGQLTMTSKPGQFNLKGPGGTITLRQVPFSLGLELAKAKLLGQTVPTSP